MCTFPAHRRRRQTDRRPLLPPRSQERAPPHPSPTPSRPPSPPPSQSRTCPAAPIADAKSAALSSLPLSGKPIPDIAPSNGSSTDQAKPTRPRSSIMSRRQSTKKGRVFARPSPRSLLLAHSPASVSSIVVPAFPIRCCRSHRCRFAGVVLWSWAILW